MGTAADCDTDHESSVWLRSYAGQGEHLHMGTLELLYTMSVGPGIGMRTQ